MLTENKAWWVDEDQKISYEDFARARDALRKADLSDHKLYLHHSGALIATNGHETKILNEWALESPTEAAGEFK